MISEKSKRFDSEYTDEQGGGFANRALWGKKKRKIGDYGVYLRCVIFARLLGLECERMEETGR